MYSTSKLVQSWARKAAGVKSWKAQTQQRPVRPRSLASCSPSRAYSSVAIDATPKWWLAAAGASLIAGSVFYLTQSETAQAKTQVAPNGPFSHAGEEKPNLPFYTRQEIANHKTPETGIWVIYKNGVYDITQFVDEHPGGKQRIILAAGDSIEPFWGLYQQHVSDEVAEVLERLRIGNLHPSDRIAAPAPGKDPNDPYGNDPARHPALLARMQKPYNAETPPVLLTESIITPTDLHYIRNHLPVPDINPSTYVLEISVEGSDKPPLRLTLDDLKKRFPKHEVDVTIQCAGNRRTDLNKVKEVRGLAWDIGAIGTARWGGARLRDVLKLAGYNVDDPAVLAQLQHVHFEGLDTDFTKTYTASIPSDKAAAINGDCIIAYEMNGAAIPRDHGFPVRAVVPGTVGARNVKWLHKVKAASVENDGHWQQNDYKGFSPNIDWNNADYKAAPAIQDLPVQSTITVPAPNTTFDEGTDEVPVRGYAWAGGGRGIIRVDVSGDGGATWTTATLERPEQPLTRTWAWTLFSANVPVQPKKDGSVDLVCKAVDSSYNTQPDTTAPIWNLRGVLSNAWHHVSVKVQQDDGKSL